MDYNLLLDTDGATSRDVEGWTNSWGDQVSVYWGTPEQQGNQWIIPLSQVNDVEKLKAAVTYTMNEIGSKLNNFQLADT